MMYRFLQSINFAFLTIFSTLLLIGCNSDDNKDDNQSPQVLTLTTPDNEVLPLQAVVLHSSTQFTDTAYPAEFAGEQVQLFTSGQGKLIFPVPDVAPGTYHLELSLDGQKGVLELHVGDAGITPQNAGQVIQQELEIPLTQYRNELTAMAALTGFPPALQEQIASAGLMLDRYFEKLEAVTAAEKIQLARFYKANPFFTSDYLQAGRSGLSNPQYDCFKVNRNKVILTVVSVVAFVDILPTLVAAGPWGSLTAVVGLVAGVTAAVCIISGAQELLINDCLYPYKQFLEDQAGSVNSFTTANAQELVLSVKSLHKNLSQEAAGSSSALVSSLAEKLTLVKDKWTTIKSGVNTIVASASGWFGSWFDQTPQTEITYDFATLPASSPETELQANTEYITIADFPQDIEVTVSKSGSEVHLKLEADPATLPRTVSGKIRYDDGDFITEDTFSVTLETYDCSGSNLEITATVQGSAATANASGGQPPYSYQWSNGENSSSVSGMEPGDYTVTVTDDNGCMASAGVVIEEIVFNYAGTWVRRIYSNGELYQDDKIVFDSNGYSISSQYNIYPSADGWVEGSEEWSLVYEDGFITITNLAWNTSLSFVVNNPNATQFYLPGQEEFSSEGDWWILTRE